MTNLTQSTTNINIEPTRLEADHYQTPSFTTPGKIYNQKYNYDLMRWECDCGDATKNHNPNCKHNKNLRAHIHSKMQELAQAPKQHSSSAELIQVLTRISKLEQAQDRTDGTLENLDHALGIKADQIALMQDRQRSFENLQKQLTTLQDRSYAAEADNEELEHKIDQQSHTINRQQQQLDRQADLISSLQTSVCRLNERTITQDETIKKLLAALDQQGNFMQALALQAEMYKRLYEDQAQQIDKLYEQISQPRPATEQVVRVVIEQPAPRQARQAREEQPAKEERIYEYRDDKGKITGCKVGKFDVSVVGNSAASCNCSIGKVGRQCGHMIDTDKFLSK